MNARSMAKAVLKPPRRVVRRAGGTVAGSVVGVRTDAPHVALTFDDGPEPGGTDRVLGALADAGATATFFMLLTRVRKYRSLADEVVAAGHEVALHGLDHRALPTLRPSEVGPMLRDGKAELEDALDRPVRWYRPPYGHQTPGNWRAIRGAGLESVLWGPSTWDWKGVPAAERLAGALEDVGPGAVLLAHDGFAVPEDGVDDGPPPLLDRGDMVTDILGAYAERGLSGRSFGEVLRGGRLVFEARFAR